MVRGAPQSVEEPGLYSGADWVSNIYERKNSKAKRGQQIPPFPCGQFFQVHGSKLKLHPVRHLSQASVLRITHRVFFLGVREDPLNGFLSALVELRVRRRIKACNGSGMPKRQWCREHGISYSTFMRWQRSLRNELAGEIMVTQAVVPLQIEPQTSRCTPAQEVTIQKDGISISMHGVSSDMVIAIVRGLLSC